MINNELKSCIETIKLREKVLNLLDEKLKQENPNNKIFKNENLKMKLEYKYNKYIHIRNKILLTSNERILKNILNDLEII